MESWTAYLAGYVAITYLFLLCRPSLRARDAWMMLSGLGVTYLCFFYLNKNIAESGFYISVGLALVFYYLMLLFRSTSAFSAVVMIGTPLAVLVTMKTGGIPVVVGFSYLAFRAIYMSYQLNAGLISPPGVVRYLGYIFFPLTFLVGPMNPYRNHEASLLSGQRPVAAHSRCLGRV
ncbi:MAG: hypothetical protein K2Q01_07535, partial [Rickettsiales bacterium]|nr:hypothetical protein [Rickettsiales bacterium]